ncbi:hypothetical protein [Roseomonas sp. 18066]|uniref:hypothetical protein n=1 Tax=Roseomonas sp. 18066 TaxID=2681412 RepID=UPI00135B7A42|nr:hypothetical protein [Roseomonas sp. 18066]
MSRRQAPAIFVTDTEAAEMIVRSQQLGEASRMPAFRAAREGAICLAIAAYGARVPARVLSAERPTTILLTDDHPDAVGRKGWPQVRRLLRWARLVVLHATGGQPEHYSFIVEATLATKRVLVIEMEYRHHAEWLALADQYASHLRILNIVPPVGGTHPVGHAPAGTVFQ